MKAKRLFLLGAGVILTSLANAQNLPTIVNGGEKAIVGVAKGAAVAPRATSGVIEAAVTSKAAAIGSTTARTPQSVVSGTLPSGVASGRVPTATSSPTDPSPRVKSAVEELKTSTFFDPRRPLNVQVFRLANKGHVFTQSQLAELVTLDSFHTVLGVPAMYHKFARVQAVQANGGEEVVTVLNNGAEETKNIATAGDWIVTNPGGERYIVPQSKFAKKYVSAADELGEGWYKPAGGPQRFVQIYEDMDILASWGEVQHLKKGAYLNITNLSDIYGVAEAEFNDTYRLLE